MPKHSSYQKLALVYALNGFGGDYNRSREEARTLYIFREFIDNQMILLQDRIDFQSSLNRERNPEDVFHRQEMDPLRTALDDFAKACNALNQDYQQHLNDLPSTKAKLDEAAAAAEALEKEYNKYKQLHPEMIRGYEEASNFDEIWTNDIYESIGDNVLKANGYRIPEYPAVDAPQAGDPKPVPLPPDTSYQQLATHISAGISPEGKAFDDAETLVRFNQGLYNQYSQYQQERIKANQENRDTTLLNKKMQAVSVLYESIQQLLNNGLNLKVAATNPEATAEEKKKAMSAATNSSIAVVKNYAAFQNTCATDLKNIQGYKDFNSLWTKGNMRDGQDLEAALGLVHTNKSPDSLQQDIQNAHSPWPNIVTLDKLSSKGRFDSEKTTRLTKVLASAALSSENMDTKKALSAQGNAVIQLLGGADTAPYLKKQYLRSLSSLPQVLKDNYAFLAQKAEEDPDYGRTKFNQDLKDLARHLNLDISELHLPEHAEAEEQMSEWKQQIKNVRTGAKPTLNTASSKLARMLVSSMNEARNEPFSRDKLNKDIAAMKKNAMFKQIAKDPDRCIRLIEDGNPSAVISAMSNPFAAASLDDKRKALEKLQLYKEAGFVSSIKGRSEEWKRFDRALSNIDLKNPETFDQQLEEVFNASEGYMKGKKALSSDNERNERFDQCMDALKIVSDVSPYAKDKVNQIVDRTNEVRTRWGRHQSTYDLNLYSRPSVDTIDKLHSQIDEAKYNPEKMAELKNHPKLNNISLVHPEIKEAGYGWEIIDRPNEAQNNQVNI